MRVGLYTDYPYRRAVGELSADRSFAIFANQLASAFDGLTLFGRLDPDGPPFRHPIPAEIDFVPLPYYETLSHPFAVVRTAGSALRQYWRTIEELDCIWLLGPHPFAIAFAILGMLRRKRVVLGVRQDWIAYVNHRHPRSRFLRAAALVMEGTFRGLGMLTGVVAVGPDLARRYRGARRLLEISVSLVDDADVVAPADALKRAYEGELTVLSVGRLENEKNPLILADILARLRREDPPWRLVVCGEGPMRPDLASRLARLGTAEHADLLGYVPFGPGLLDLYKQSHAFLHVSWTEGFPQVILEAFATGVPVVATDVGGVSAAVGGAVRLVPPGDPAAAAQELIAIAANPELREALVFAGNNHVRERTLSAEAARVAAFLMG